MLHKIKSMKWWATSLGLIAAWMLLSPAVQSAEFVLQQQKEGITVSRNGKLVTRYLVFSGAKPILWPLIGPHGEEMTRGYPMREAIDTERSDHVHHRSFWFTHGNVNGIDFWSESKGHGKIVHRKFELVQGGEQAVIVSRNDWMSPEGKKVCEDVRRLTFGSQGSSYWIDFDTTVTASVGPVKFGDTKEGSFGVRVAGSMKVDSKPGGHVVNTHGDKDKAAWGKAAPWVDYYGSATPKGKVVGITIMNHPSSFRYPTYWHVRTYGLFTANPFGLHHFKGDNSVDGSHQMKKGETMTLHYRVLVHPGDTQQAEVAGQFKKYQDLKKTPLK